MSNDAQTANRKHETVGERHSLALPIELEEGAPPYFARAALAVISGLVLTLLVWANVAHIRELSVAVGEIAPYGSTRKIAHLEGGIIKQVFVSPGDVVEADTPLAELQIDSAGGDYDRLSARHINLSLQIERLTAQAEDREPGFSKPSTRNTDLVTEQLAIYSAATNRHKADTETLKERAASAIAEVQKAEIEYKSQAELLGYAKEQLSIQETLIEDGFTSRQAFLEAKSSVSSATASEAAAKARLEQAERAESVTEAELSSLKATYRNQIAEERALAVAELVEMKEPLQSLKYRTERLTIRAPIDGVVKNITVDGAGDVVSPGGLVAEITPTDNVLFAEVRVNPKDIGHITIGQKTEISVTTFDPNRYGKLNGHVSHLSAGSFIDDRTGEPYYTAYVALDRQDIGKGRMLRELSPGMEVRAEIVTQSRTMMVYLLKPVARSLDQAFTER